MKRIIKHSVIALSTVLAVGLTACTEEVNYIPADLVASDCVKASFRTDANALVLSSTDENKFSIPLYREVTDGESVVLLNPTHLNSSIFQIPESVTFAAGADETSVDVTFSAESMELEEEYTYSIELEESAYDPYSENTISTTTGTVLKQANWNQELGVGSITFNAIGAGGACQVQGTSDAQSWFKAVDPVGAGTDLVFKVNEDGTIRFRQQLLCGIRVNIGSPNDPVSTLCYLSLNSAYTGMEVALDEAGTLVAKVNTYDSQLGLMVLALDYTCEYGTLASGSLEIFQVPAAPNK